MTLDKIEMEKLQEELEEWEDTKELLLHDPAYNQPEDEESLSMCLEEISDIKIKLKKGGHNT